MNKYSPNETALIKLLRNHTGEPLTSKEIVDRHYPRKTRPFYARQSVVCVLNSLVGKVQRNREDFRIKKTKRRGPWPNKYWVE